MEIFVICFFFWLGPLVFFCWLASNNGKSVKVVFACGFLFGPVGGLLSFLLLPEVEAEAAVDPLEEARREAALRAMGKRPGAGSSFSAERRRELEQLLGGRRREAAWEGVLFSGCGSL